MYEIVTVPYVTLVLCLVTFVNIHVQFRVRSVSSNDQIIQLAVSKKPWWKYWIFREVHFY